MTDLSEGAKKLLKQVLKETHSSIRRQDGKYILFRNDELATLGVLVDSLPHAVKFMSLYSRLWASADDLATLTPVGLLDSPYYFYFDFNAEEGPNTSDPKSSSYRSNLKLSHYDRCLLMRVSSSLESLVEVSLDFVDEASEEEIRYHSSCRRVAALLTKDLPLL